MDKFDLMIFGATGWTGTFLVRELASTYKNEQITWAVAGRSSERLDALIQSVSAEKDCDLSHIEKFIVDTNNLDSVKNMCEHSKIVINCVGPYRFTGELIVKKCLDSGAHHLDVSGEPEFLESMQLKFNDEATEKNIFIIGSCGFDSVPADIGVIYTQNMFKSDLEYIESFITFTTDGPAYINYATWESAVHGFGAAKNLSKIRKDLFKSRLPRPSFPAPKRSNRIGYFFEPVMKKYCFNFMGSDKSVVQRTQHFNHDTLNEKAVQYMPYFTIENYSSVLKMIVYGLSFGILANYELGRNILLTHFGFFSGGLVRKLEKQKVDVESKNTKFTNQFRGVGHSRKLENKNDIHTEKPDQMIVTEMSGPEAYESTAILALDCALTLLQEKDKIPVKGGVLTPGAAFGKTNIIERLIGHGMKFNVLYHGPKNEFKN